MGKNNRRHSLEESNPDVPSLASLKQQRTKGSITRIKTLTEKEGCASISSTEWECRIGILESYFKQLLSCQSQIECLDPSDTGRGDVEDLYVTTKSRILNLMGQRQINSFECSFAAPSQPTNRLPHLRLPKFNGKYSEYKNFISSFKNLVDSDSTLTKIEKFNHLLSCLSDQALGTVRAFQVTEEKYTKALDKLKERYHNDTLIFLENIAALFDLPKCSKSSAPQLRNLVDSISAIFSSLLSLGSESNICNAIIIYIAMSKVDSETQSKWDEQIDYSKLPCWDDCAKLISKRCQYLEARDNKHGQSDQSGRSDSHFRWQNKPKSKIISQTSLAIVQKTCSFCNDTAHLISHCASFNKLSVHERFANTKKLGLCINCLVKGHNISKCPSTYRCKTCKQPHHTLLHREQQASSRNINDEPSSSLSSATTAIASMQPEPTMSSSQVILATALVLVKDSTGTYHIGRALLDSGSQINLMSERFVRILNLRKSRKQVEIIGVGVSQTQSHFQTQTVVRSRFDSFEVAMEFLVTPIITGYQPDKKVPMVDLNVPQNIELADENFNQPSRIDVLLGAEAFFDVLSIGQLKLGDGLPTLQKTRLGWIVSGIYTAKVDASRLLCCLSTQDSSLQTYVEKFWEFEETSGRKHKWTEEQAECEARFLETIQTLPSGRLSVQLPFKKDPGCLGVSYDIASKRFLSLERKLKKNPSLKAEYVQFLKEYEDLGHMRLVENPDFNEPHYFIPHHCVLKPNSTTTKLRVVFDASCCTSSQVSLNGVLMVGLTIQDDLFIILLRFRLHRYALTADVVKMYRQVEIDPSHRRFQRILWRDNEYTPIKTYELNTVTYGTSAAPFLAIRCLRYLSDKYSAAYSLGSKIVASDFYVDDMITGADDLQSLLQIKDEVSTILGSACFELSKWNSNHPSLVESHCPSTKDLKLTEQNLTSTLGITWDPKNDNFQFSYHPNRTYSKVCKLTILSLSSSLFDPMGLLAPIIIKAKVIIQKLWIEGLKWEASIPQVLDTEWRQFLSDLHSLQNLPIPRYVFSDNKADIEIHGFCDASMNAYGCCLYVSTTDQRGNVATKLLVAKSRVAPIKRKQLPRLELCGAHLLARLWTKVKSIFGESYSDVYFWTDSEIVLHWIATHSSKLSTFVGNRIAEIQEKSIGVAWRHVPSEKNPADILSRGCTVQNLQQSMLFLGPSFLLFDKVKWPVSSRRELSKMELDLETRKTVLVCQNRFRSHLLGVIDRHDSYLKTLRIIAYVLRFDSRLTKAKPEFLSPEDFRMSLLHIVCVIQNEFFSEEISAIKSGRNLKGSIKWLSPFLDNSTGLELLRVGGRLKHADLPMERKHPLLLPKKCSFVERMVKHLHMSNFRAGPKVLVSLLRREFWVVNAREVARRIVKNCIHCV